MIEVKLPQLAEDVNESLVVLWYVEEGDPVEEGDILVEVQTEKAVSEIKAEVSGTVRQIAVDRGESVKVGSLLAVIEQTVGSENTNGEKKEPAQQPETNSPSKEKEEQGGFVRVSPRLRKLAKELGVNLESVTGTGKKGNITEEDIQKAANQGKEEKQEMKDEEDEFKAIPLTGMRGTIARRMKESLHNSAQLTETAWADVTKLASKKEQLGDSVGWTALIAAAVAKTLRRHPELNAHITEEEILPQKDVHLGFAIDTPQGLQVAVVRNASEKSPSELHEELAALAEKARNGKLTKEDLSGGTFTVTSLGQYGIQFFTPIINPPEAGIIGLGKIEPYLELDDGKVRERKRLPLSLTFDHGAIDGAPAARFLQDLITLLEKPKRFLEKSGDS